MRTLRDVGVCFVVASLLVLALPRFAPEASGSGSWTEHRGVSYDIDSPPAFPSGPEHNQLDLYVPEPVPEQAAPVVVWVHGGAWIRGDKANQMDHKVPLFVGEGYLLASINYRLSPDPPVPVLPGRVRHPDHVHDVAEAIAWLHRNVAAFGGDPERILLIGHSAGAHLIALAATDPSYLQAYGVDPAVVRGVVPLDSAAYDIPADQDPGYAHDSGPLGLVLQWNAFGNPVEETVDPRWADASPLTWADPGDAPFLLVTQRGDHRRLDRNRALAAALGQDPDSTVLLLDKTHAEINGHLGSPEDDSPLTERVVGFLATHAG